MALAFPKKNNNRGIVGLDLDGEFIAAVQTSADGITRAVSAELPPGVITDGEERRGSEDAVRHDPVLEVDCRDGDEHRDERQPRP